MVAPALTTWETLSAFAPVGSSARSVKSMWTNARHLHVNTTPRASTWPEGSGATVSPVTKVGCARQRLTNAKVSHA